MENSIPDTINNSSSVLCEVTTLPIYQVALHAS